MHKLLFICPEYTPPLMKPDAQDLIKEYWSYLIPNKNGIKLYRGGAYEELSLTEAQPKLKEIYDIVDYIIYQKPNKVTYLSVFDNIIDIFQEYQNPELGAIYTDYYQATQGLNIHNFVRSFTPDDFVKNIPPVLIINKKYLQGNLPINLDQQFAMQLINSVPLIHIPEASYIIHD